MSTSDDIRPAARALQIAESRQRDNAAHDGLVLIDELDAHPCVAFVVEFHSALDYSPSLDVAVEMLCCARQGGEVYDGNMIWRLRPEQATPEAISTASRIVNECVTALTNSGDWFALLVHIHGQRELQLRYGDGGTWETALQDLQHSIGDEVTYMI